MRRLWQLVGRIAGLAFAASAFVASAPLVSSAYAQVPIQLDPGAPSWTKNIVMYELNPRGFTSPDGVGDGNGSGTFPSLEAKLPYLHHLGINAIWLSGYSLATDWDFNVWSVYGTVDPSVIDPLLGTPSDFRAFVNAAHQDGIHVFLDVPTEGVVLPSPLVQEHPDWFTGISDFGSTDYETFNWNNPTFRAWYVKVWTDYVTQDGVDGFRLDIGFHDEAVFDQIRANAAAAGHPIAIFGETDHYDFSEVIDLNECVPCGTAPGGSNAQDLPTEWNNLPYQYNSMMISVHDNGSGSSRGVNSYTIQGNGANWANGLLAPTIPIWYAGEEFNDDEVNLPNVSTAWLEGSQLQWGQLAEPSHAAFLAESTKLLAIRAANDDLLNADRASGGMAAIPTATPPYSEDWTPWVKYLYGQRESWWSRTLTRLIRKLTRWRFRWRRWVSLVTAATQ